MDSEIPIWFYKAIALVVFWLAGQVLVEWIKMKMKKEVAWNGDERRQTFSIGDDIIAKLLLAYEKHIVVMEDFAQNSRIKNDLLIAIGVQLKDHKEIEEETHRLMKCVYEKIHRPV